MAFRLPSLMYTQRTVWFKGEKGGVILEKSSERLLFWSSEMMLFWSSEMMLFWSSELLLYERLAG